MNTKIVLYGDHINSHDNCIIEMNHRSGADNIFMHIIA